MRRAKTTTIEHALRIVASDVLAGHKLASGSCVEAANRLAEMRELLKEAKQRGGETWASSFARAVSGVLT